MDGGGKTIYLFLQKRLMECTNRDGTINYKMIKTKIANFKIPKCLIPNVIKDMERHELIERESNFNFRIINKTKCEHIEMMVEGWPI